MVIIYSYAHFVPSLTEHINNSTALQQNRTLEMFPQQPTMTAIPQSTTVPAVVMTVWKGVELWMPSALNKVLGFALWTILIQRRELDHEQEVRREQQGYHVLSADSDLPAPVASASTMEGFKTEAEIRRLRLRVPTWPRLFVGVWLLVRTIDGMSHISRLSGTWQGIAISASENFQGCWPSYDLKQNSQTNKKRKKQQEPILEFPETDAAHFSTNTIPPLFWMLSPKLGSVQQAEWAFYLVQGIAGLYVIYSKTLIHTQWLFYSICVTTFHTASKSSIEHWYEDFSDIPLPSKDRGTEQFAKEVAFFRAVKMIASNALFLYRLWVAWRLVEDLKERDARVARARRVQ